MAVASMRNWKKNSLHEASKIKAKHDTTRKDLNLEGKKFLPSGTQKLASSISL